MNNDRANTERLPLFFGACLIVGALALCAALFDIERHGMYGVAIGCIPTGALGLALSLLTTRWVAKHHPDWIEKKRNAMDERRVQVKHHAGYAMFWISFGYMTIYTAFSSTRLIGSIGSAAFGSATLVLMSLGFWVALFVLNRRY